MRFFACMISILILASQSAADDLTLNGTDITTVEVERQVVVKDKFQLVKVFPFTISAPKGGNLYVWHVPDGVTCNKKSETLEITAAPVGKLTVCVSWLLVDFDKKTTTEKSAKLTLIVGSVAPPDPLTIQFAAIYAADTGADKATNLAALAAIMKQASALAATGSVTTAGQLADAVRTVAAAKMPAGALKALRSKIGEVIAAAMPSDPDAALDAATRKAAVDLYARLGACLEAVK